MQFARRPAALFLAAALLSTAACSESTGPRGSLTTAELTELAAQMGAHFATSFSGSAAAFSRGDASLAAAGVPFSFKVNVNVPCPRGGRTGVIAELTGDIENGGQTFTADAEGTHTPNECGFDVEGKTIWVSGTLTTAAHVAIVNGFPKGVQRASLEGSGLSWRTSDGRSGTCQSINYLAKADYDNNRAEVNGNFCGSTIAFTGPLTTN